MDEPLEWVTKVLCEIENDVLRKWGLEKPTQPWRYRTVLGVGKWDAEYADGKVILSRVEPRTTIIVPVEKLVLGEWDIHSE